MTEIPVPVAVDPLDLPVTRRSARRSLLLCGLVIGLVLGGLVLAAGYEFWQASKTTAALCTLRADLRVQVRDSQGFLDKHPAGIPGISRKDIETGMNRQRRTIKSLRHLSCPPDPPPPTR